MDDKQKRLVRNTASGVVLCVLMLFVLAYCGVFEGAQSDEAQIRKLVERSSDEISSHDWPDLFALCDLTPEEQQAWIKAVPPRAEYVTIVSATPAGRFTVPAGATEYEMDLTVVAQYGAMGIGPQFDNITCHVCIIKKNGRWYIDINNPKTDFGAYVQKPKMP